MNHKIFYSLVFTAFITMTVYGQQKATPEQPEYYSPAPKVITPGSANFGAPSDAIILFDGKKLQKRFYEFLFEIDKQKKYLCK